MSVDYDGVIETAIRIKVKVTHYENEEHYFKFNLNEKAYLLVKEMLETGAPVNFALQMTRSKQKEVK